MKMFSIVKCLLSVTLLSSTVSTQRIPNPPFPNFNVPLDPLQDLGESRRETPRFKAEQRNSEDYINFYQLKIFKHYELNVTNWEEIWVDFDEHPVSMQNRLVQELRFKQKTIEMMLTSLCDDQCIRETCAMSLERNLEIRPKNPERWARYFGLEWSDIPIKVKRMVIMQLRVDRFRIASALQMMNLEVCHSTSGDGSMSSNTESTTSSTTQSDEN